MATFSITEYKQLGRDLQGSALPAGEEPALDRHTFTFTTSSALSQEIPEGTNVVRIIADTDCYFAVGTNPDASVKGSMLPAGQVEFVGLNRKGRPYKISAVEIV